MKQIVLCWIHIWKLFLYGSYKRGLRYSPSKFGNWWFQRKKKSHLECCYAKKLFTHVFDLRKKETTKKTYNCLGGGNKILSSERDLLWAMKKISFSPVSKMAALRLRFVQATDEQNCTAVFKRCRPWASDTAICAFRNVSWPVSWLIN